MSRSTGNSGNGGCTRDTGNQASTDWQSPVVILGEPPSQLTIAASSSALMTLGVDLSGVGSVTPSSGLLQLAGTVNIGQTHVMSGEMGTLTGNLSLSADGSNSVRTLNPLSVISSITPQQSIRTDSAGTHKLDTTISSAGLITLTPSSSALTIAGALTVGSVSSGSVSAPASSNLSLSTTDSSGTVNIAKNVHLTQSTSLFLREDNQSHSLFYSGSARMFDGISPEGPVLEGHEGGILAISDGGDRSCLTWNREGIAVGTRAMPEYQVPFHVRGKARLSADASNRVELLSSAGGALVINPTSTPQEVNLGSLTLQPGVVTTSSGDLVLSSAGGNVTSSGTLHATTALLGDPFNPIRITGTASIDCDPGIQMESISGGLVCQTAGGLYVSARSAPSTDYVRFQCTSTGNLLITPQLNSTSIFSRLSVGTSATPTVGQLHVQGNQSSQWGPHVSLAYNSGSWPIKMQLLPFSEGNHQILLDAHFDGSNVLSSSDNGCSRITRTSTGLSLEGSASLSGVTAVWTRGLHINDNGSCDVGVSLTSAGPIQGTTLASTRGTYEMTGHGATLPVSPGFMSITTSLSTTAADVMLSAGIQAGQLLYLFNASIYGILFLADKDTARLEHNGTNKTLAAGMGLSLIWEPNLGTGRWLFPSALIP